jgi:hypothetical protein
LPSPNGLMPVASATVSPPLEAPGEGGKVGAADGDCPGSLEARDDGSVSPRIRARQRLESLRGRRTGKIDVPFDREGDAVERR